MMRLRYRGNCVRKTRTSFSYKLQQTCCFFKSLANNLIASTSTSAAPTSSGVGVIVVVIIAVVATTIVAGVVVVVVVTIVIGGGLGFSSSTSGVSAPSSISLGRSVVVRGIGPFKSNHHLGSLGDLESISLESLHSGINSLL